MMFALALPKPRPSRAFGRIGKTAQLCWRQHAGFRASAAAANLVCKVGGAGIKGDSRPRAEYRKLIRMYATESTDTAAHIIDKERLSMLKNIGISAHIDSGKTTLTERILFYTGRINEIHEVRGRDNVGATMDWMELEREKGITIQSAATRAKWNNQNLNIIDTPGHVDFTIEVERALRVLDGAILVLCAVSGVQSQTITVDRQMKRYDVPRICFVNKMDRAGANPDRIVEQIRSKLRIPAALVQLPIGKESELVGVVDLIRMKSILNTGARGEVLVTEEVPPNLLQKAQQKRTELIEALADVDDTFGDLFLDEIEPSEIQIKEAIRRATIALKFTPVFVGSAFKDTGVQPLLDGVCEYLPTPTEVKNYALDLDNNEERVEIKPYSKYPFVGLAFKLEDGRYGQLTYLRVYQGKLVKGQVAYHVKTKKRVKISRLVRMHSNSMEDVNEVGAGEICALFGIDCASGDTFSDGALNYSMSSMFVPNPVISLALSPKDKASSNFSKALSRFQREDPTFRVGLDADSKQIIISGMGELHLQIYVERMKREYGVDCVTGNPQVAYRETLTKHSPFNYTHKKQTGGAGQFARVVGYIEPIADDDEFEGNFEFVNKVVGGSIPEQYFSACEKGFLDATKTGFLTGHPMTKLRLVLTDGLAHSVDSSEMAFRTAVHNAFKGAFFAANPQILEPIMKVEVSCPSEFQGVILTSINRRKGVIADTETQDDFSTVTADIPLSNMFGYSTDLRSVTQGKGEFSMEYKCHQPVLPYIQEELVLEYQKQRAK